MSNSIQGPGWWLASDGNWYPPETAGSTVTTPEVSAGRTTLFPSAAVKIGVLAATALALTVLVAAGVAMAGPLVGIGAGTSHNSAKDVAQYCTDVAYIDNLGSSFDSASTPTAGQINQLLPIAEKIAKEAPSAVHGDAAATLAYLKAAAKGNTAPPSAFQAATAHESAWNTQHCH